MDFQELQNGGSFKGTVPSRPETLVNISSQSTPSRVVLTSPTGRVGKGKSRQSVENLGLEHMLSRDT